MNRKILTFILTITFLLFLDSPSIAVIDDYQDAVDAYNREDYKTSYQLMLPLAKKGFAQAQYNLGVMYEKGKGVKQNHRKAKKWFSLAADQGLIQAQTTLASMYHEGEGVSKNYEAASKWYHLAAEQGDADAQYKLGLMYSNGEGISQDNKEATKWFQLAVEQGNTLAQEKLDEILNKNNLWKKIKDIF